MFSKIYINFFSKITIRAISLCAVTCCLLPIVCFQPQAGYSFQESQSTANLPERSPYTPLKPQHRILRVFNSRDLYARIQMAYQLARKNNRNFREYLNFYLIGPHETKAGVIEDAMCMAIKINDLELFKYLLRHFDGDIYMQDNLPLRWISMEGKPEFVRFILEFADFSEENLQEALEWARFGENWPAYKIIHQQLPAAGTDS